MIITSRLLEAHLKCSTKCSLRSLGETEIGNARADSVQTQNESYRNSGVKRLLERYPHDECATGPLDAVSLKTATWRLAINITIREHDLESTIHAVERIPSEERGQAAQFIPIRLVTTNKLAKNDKLLLAFDALVLSKALGREVVLGKIIHGDDHTILKVKISALAGDVRKRLGKIATLLAKPSPPDLVLNRHCVECEFRDRCRPKAVEKDDLSLISGISQKEILKLNKKGIFSVTQLSHTYRPRRGRRKTKPVDKHSHALKALAIREKKIYVTKTEKPHLGRVLVFFDVEGIPDRDFYYLIGAKVVDGATERTHSFWADNRAGEERIWTEFLALLSTFDSFSLLHFGGYDSEFVSRMMKKYGTVPEITEERIMEGVYLPTAQKLAEICGYSCEDLFPIDLYQNVTKNVIVKTIGLHKLPFMKEQKLIADGIVHEVIDDVSALRNHQVGQTLNSGLSPTQRDVIEQRFGIGDKVEKTLQQVAEKIGITRERVRQIECKAIRLLKHPRRSTGLGDYA